MKSKETSKLEKPRKTITLTFKDKAQKKQLEDKAKAENRSLSNYLLIKGLSVVVLFFTLSVSAQDSITLPRETYIEIYKGLKAEEYYRTEYNKCVSVAEQLNQTIQSQNDSLQLSMSRLDETNYELDYLNYQYQEVLKRDSKKWTFGGAGLVIGLITGLILGSF